MIRGLGYLKSLSDLENVPVMAKNGTPVLIKDLGTVSFGPDMREGVAEWQGEGETVGGIVVMRYGLNALTRNRRRQEEARGDQTFAPSGRGNRGGLRPRRFDPRIHQDLAARPGGRGHHRQLRHHHLSVSFPFGADSDHHAADCGLDAFIPMYYLHVSSNIMSLGGLALAIGVLVDAAIVMVENGYRHLSEAPIHCECRSHLSGATEARANPAWISAKQVGPALFFSLVIIVVSFLPVFLLEAQEGRMFRPLAWTKTLAVGFSSVLAITLVPVLMVMFIKGRLRPESQNPISRITQAMYLPVLRLCLKYRKTTLLLNLIFLAVTFPLMFKIGSQFMPPLYEGSALYMPTPYPASPSSQASQLLQEQDRIIRSFPEVETVFGAVGRSDSATDNAPLDMYDTTVMLKPREQWRPGMTYEKLIQEMDAKLQFPGLRNTWTMPVENRLDMELTGIKTPLGMKIQGPTLDGIQQLGTQIQQILSRFLECGPSLPSVFRKAFTSMSKSIVPKPPGMG